MQAFVFKGPLVNLGRFGFVNANDTLLLTSKEAEAIKGDKRFEPLKGEKPKPGHFLEIKPEMTPEDIRDVKNHNRAEQARLDRLAQENADEVVAITELRELPMSELEARADRLKVPYDNRTGKPDLIKRLAGAMQRARK
jgi:hypothetical protein